MSIHRCKKMRIAYTMGAACVATNGFCTPATLATPAALPTSVDINSKRK